MVRTVQIFLTTAQTNTHPIIRQLIPNSMFPKKICPSPNKKPNIDAIERIILISEGNN